MTRKALILAAGGVLAIALVGTALSAGAAEITGGGDDPARPTATTVTDPTGLPDPTAPTASTDPTGLPTSTDPTAPNGGTSITPGKSATASATAGRTAAPAGTVSRDRAVEIARGHVGGGQLDKVESEMEHGRQVWSVRLVKDGDRVRVDVDAGTGRVTRVERKSDDN